MTISLERRQKLAAIARAHDEWVDEHLADVAPVFDPAAHPKPDSDYNQHNVDVDASGEAEDELAAKAAAIFGEPMTAAGDPDWDPAEHPRGPDGKFIEDGFPDVIALKKKISETSVAKNVAYMKDEDYKAQALHEELLKLEKQLADLEAAPKAPHMPKHAAPVPKLSPSPSAPVAGKPITAWTKTIYSGKYADGEIVAVKDDGAISARLVWDAETKKFQWQTKSAHAASSGWVTAAQLTKKDAYAKFKDEKKSWTTPAASTFIVDSAPPPVGFDDSESEFSAPIFSAKDAVANGDFSSLTQVGQQAGSTSGGFFEAPNGSRWYVKSQHSSEHANNEALAAALYQAAGVDVPQVIRGSGAPGLGPNQTATRIIEGAKPNLKQKLNDPAYLAKIREGFAVDAWLANWDAAGLVLDNIVEGDDGDPHRIDVGGSLIFRAMGGKKGAAFGSTVGELETLRDPQMAPAAAKVFGGISDEELSASAAKVAAVSPDAIRKLVTDFDMDPSVADTLIARREDLISQTSAVEPGASSTSPEFTILPKSKRGKSGDAHFAPKIWGKYGAAGVMMRHVDDNGIERFLLVKANTTNSKRWQLPGGALEELETPEQGAAREVHEELGFTQEFLHHMTPIGTHKVTIDVPEKGQWSYSNIAVDVPSQPDLKWDENELGGAQWFTAQQLSAMSVDDEIHPALAGNLSQILGKFTQPSQAAPASAPAPAPAISQQSTEPSTKWTKSKFTQSMAYKKDYADGEVIGIAKFDSAPGGGDSTRIVWSNGKFRKYTFDGKLWQYSGEYGTKKAALTELNDKPFYVPPKGTMANTNQDFIAGTSLISGKPTIAVSSKQDSLQELLDAVLDAAPFTPSSKITSELFPHGAFGSYKESFMVSGNGQHIGAVHLRSDGTWAAVVAAASGRAGYFEAPIYAATKEQALKALEDADVKYLIAKASGQVTAPVAPAAAPKAAAAIKKTPKLTAAQIQKQNGNVPKTLKYAQKAAFNKNLKEESPVGFIHSKSEPSMTRLFTALVWAVKKHNETQSPKLNYLQGINVFDQTYGAQNKERLVAWLQTSEGKALAPNIIGGTGVSASETPGVSSPYLIGTPQKVASNKFRTMSNTDMRDLFVDMYAHDPLTSEQKSMISAYKGHAGDFNEPLRGEDSLNSYNLQKINTLQSAMRPATESFTVWRGTDGLGSAINKSTIGSLVDLKKFEGAVVGDPSFFSSAFDPDAKFSGKRFTLIVNVPKGTPSTVAWAATPSFDNEKEVILAAGLHYKIDRVEEAYSEHYNLYITVVPEVKQK